MKNKKIFIFIALIVLILGFSILMIIIVNSNKNLEQKFLDKYFSLINEGKYEELYELLSSESKAKTQKEDFIARNKNIYEGIGAKDIKISLKNIDKIEKNKVSVEYESSIETDAGNITFENVAYLVKESKKGYTINWSSNFIYPELTESDKISVKPLTATRGNIYDRDGILLAGESTVYAIGFVPGKMNVDNTKDIEDVAKLLDITEDSIKASLGASYVKDDTFVQLKKVTIDNNELIDELLKIKGIKVINSTSRVYPYKEATSHLLGYIQVDSDKDSSTYNTYIGKSGIEKAFDSKLREEDGVEIDILDSKANVKKVIAKKEPKNGEDVKLTIDINLQNKIYNELKTQNGLFVVMQPKTGEILSLVSTPSFDSNDFILGMSNNKWKSLNEDENTPLYNRFLATYCPGSTFKPITGAIGLNTKIIDKDKDYGHSGLIYKKDESWGDYSITTLKEYSGAANLKNALINSDNIYFAKIALDIGSEKLEKGLLELGFDSDIPFELNLNKSKFADNNKIETEVQLADTGYGQGKILVNPIHMASIYSAFVNDGSMVKPYLEYKDDKSAKYYKENVFSKEVSDIIKEDLVQVVEDVNGTAHQLKLNNIKIAAKTGTAELKASKDDENTKQLSWLNAFSADSSSDKQYLVVSMREKKDSNDNSYSLFPLVQSIFK